MILSTNIISENEKKVNRDIITKWTIKKDFALQLSEQLFRAGLKKRAYAIKYCGTELTMKKCEVCGKMEIQHTNLCRDKLCPVCSWRLAMKRFRRMSLILDNIASAYPEANFAFVTLTVKNCKMDKLSETLQEMSNGWNRLMSRKMMKSIVDGSAKSVEITYNEETREAHPHYHIILMSIYGNAKIAGEYLKKEWLNAVRLKTSKEAQNSQVISFKSEETHQKGDMLGAVLETFKYTQKTSDLLSMTVKDLRTYAEQVAGKRMISFTGMFKEYAKYMEYEDKADDEEWEFFVSKKECDCCGSDKIIKVLYKWSFADCKYTPQELL